MRITVEESYPGEARETPTRELLAKLDAAVAEHRRLIALEKGGARQWGYVDALDELQEILQRGWNKRMKALQRDVLGAVRGE